MSALDLSSPATVRMRRATAALIALAIGLVAVPSAEAAPVPVAAKMQWRGHLPELGERPAMRVFLNEPAYESFRASLGQANVFPPARSLFMSFDRDILALYIRGADAGGRCLQTGSNATLDGDVATLDLQWQSGTCGAPITARYPFILVSLSRAASDGSSWVQPARSVCGQPPGVDPRACASLGGTATPSPTPGTTLVPTAAPTTPAPASPTPTPSPAPPTAAPTTAPTAPPTVAVASPPPTRTPVAAASPAPTPTDESANYLFWGAVIVIALLLVIAMFLARGGREAR